MALSSPAKLRRLVLLCTIATAQAFLTIALTATVFAANMSRWDDESPPEAWVGIADGLLSALSLPLVPVVFRLPQSVRPSGFPGEHLVYLANGLIWAGVILWLHRLWRTRSGRGA